MLAERIRNEGLKELEAPGFADQARALLDRGGVELLAREMPDAWLDEITVSGTPEQCLAAIDRLGAAGATRVVLVPPSNALHRPHPLVPSPGGGSAVSKRLLRGTVTRRRIALRPMTPSSFTMSTTSSPEMDVPPKVGERLPVNPTTIT